MEIIKDVELTEHIEYNNKNKYYINIYNDLFFDYTKEKEVDKELFNYIKNNIDYLDYVKNYIVISLTQFNKLFRKNKIEKLKEKINGNN